MELRNDTNLIHLAREKNTCSKQIMKCLDKVHHQSFAKVTLIHLQHKELIQHEHQKYLSLSPKPQNLLIKHFPLDEQMYLTVCHWILFVITCISFFSTLKYHISLIGTTGNFSTCPQYWQLLLYNKPVTRRLSSAATSLHITWQLYSRMMSNQALSLRNKSDSLLSVSFLLLLPFISLFSFSPTPSLSPSAFSSITAPPTYFVFL